MKKCLLFLLALSVASFAQAAVTGVYITKDINIVQTGENLSAVDSSSFNIFVVGSSLAHITAPTVTGPFSASQLASSSHNGGVLGYNVTGDVWDYGFPDFNGCGISGIGSQAVMDSLFPNGTYTAKVYNTSVPLNLTGQYPNNPMLTLTGGTWVNGVYVIAAGQSLGMSSNVFANYGAYQDGTITLYFGTIDGDAAFSRNAIAFSSFKYTSSTANSVSTNFDTSGLISGSSYAIQLIFDSVVDYENQTGLSGVTSEADLTKSLIINVMVISPDSVPAYDTWQSLVFSPSQLADPAISGDSASPAHDGISNLMKYALNLDPWVKGLSGLPVKSMTPISGSNYLTLAYTKVIAATDLNYTVQTSTDLKTWNYGASYTTEVSALNNPDGVTQTVTVRSLLPSGGGTPKQFIRLQVIH